MSTRAANGGRLPALFIGHGSPTNALERNRYTNAWRELGESLPRPAAVLAISAHWYVEGTGVTAMEQPRTIHDFYGFPRALYEVRYPAAGDPALAKKVAAQLAPLRVGLDEDWGLDHGTWSILVHIFPHADVPVLQLSIDAMQPPSFHYALGQKLAALREAGVLIVGSGNVVHNLRTLMRQPDAPAFDWATEFNNEVREHILARKHAPLINPDQFGQAARFAIPTPDHYLPLLYVLGAQQDNEAAAVITDGIDLGSISMLSVRIG